MSGGGSNGLGRQRPGGSFRSHVVLDADPGPDGDFVDSGPVAISGRVKSEDRERFYDAIRSQGPEQIDHPEAESGTLKVRRRAIDMAKERARMDPRVSDIGFRFFEAVASRCKWKHRYYHQPVEMLSFIAGKNPSHSNAARHVDPMVDLGYLVDIRVPSETGGRHKRYLTVACTAADRKGQTLADIAAAAHRQKVRGASENLEEIVANTRNGPIRSSNVLLSNWTDAIRPPDVSTRRAHVSKRSPDALTQDRHATKARRGKEVPAPIVREDCEHCPPSSKKEESPPRPPSDECDLQHTVGGGEAPESAGLSEAIYVIHRSWWPGLSDPEADHLLDGHLKDLAGSNSKRRLEQIILTLKDEHASGRVDQPGKLVGHRVARADKRSSAARSATHTDTAGETAAFKAWQVLGRVGFGDKVTGADAMDILAAVPGSDPDTVRRHIREVCGKWTGQNKSAQHVVAEVTRQLRPPDATSQAEQAAETVRIEKPTKSAQEDAAAFAALRKQMPSARSPTGA